LGLEEKLQGDSVLYSRFVVLRTFVDTILNGTIPSGLQAVQGPNEFFTDHGRGHLLRVLNKLSELEVFLHEPLNYRECFMILVAAYCHDLGMLLGRHEGEELAETRREHHNRSAEILQKLIDGNFIVLDRFELPIIQSLVRAHRIVDLAGLPLDQWIASDRIRTRLLGSFLRVADACDIDHQRAPESIFAYYESLIPAISRDHWRRHQIVSNVHFDQVRSSVVVSVDLDGDFMETIQKSRVANTVRKELKRELDSVYDTFSRYEVGIVRVEIMDFSRETYVDFPEFQISDDYVLFQVISNTQSFQTFYDAASQFLFRDSEAGVVLVIHIAPDEGPVYVDTHCRVQTSALGDVEAAARTSFGNDLVNISRSVTPEVVEVS
jgi:hypothetical protein